MGDGAIRGISGGQKKRVTTGEFMATPARFMFFDAISNGLDSATTFDIVQTVKIICKHLHSTSVISLLQV